MTAAIARPTRRALPAAAAAGAQTKKTPAPIIDASPMKIARTVPIRRSRVVTRTPYFAKVNECETGLVDSYPELEGYEPIESKPAPTNRRRRLIQAAALVGIVLLLL